MPLVIANNVPSLTAQHHLMRSNTDLQRSLERLSSGLRVNRGADDPAALVISEKQRAQIAGLDKAIENTEKAISLLQTAEGALGEINALLVKVRSLALDSANTGVNDDDALAANQAEIDNAVDTIRRIAENTQFATKKLLDGSAGRSGVPSQPANVSFSRATEETVPGTYAISVTTAGERATVEASVAQTSALAADEILVLNGVQITLSAGLTQAQVISEINDVTDQTGVLADANGTGGATRLYTSAFGSAAAVEISSNAAAAADSAGFGTTALTDTGVDVVATVGGTSFTGEGNVITVDSGPATGLSFQIAAATGASAHQTVSGAVGNIAVLDNSLIFQIGPNQFQTVSVTVGSALPTALGAGVAGNIFRNLAEIEVTSATKAHNSIGIIDQAIDEVTTLRGVLGAFQKNTLESTANNMRTTLENVVNAESVIRDTDFAAEIASFTKHQVLVQSGISVLSSANQTSQLVLQLLQ